MKRGIVVSIFLCCNTVLSETFQTSTLGINFVYQFFRVNNFTRLRSHLAEKRNCEQQDDLHQCHHLPPSHHLLQRAPEEPPGVGAELPRCPEEGGPGGAGGAGGGREEGRGGGEGGEVQHQAAGHSL